MLPNQFLMTQMVTEFDIPVGFIGCGLDNVYYIAVIKNSYIQGIPLIKIENKWTIPEDERDPPPKMPARSSQADRNYSQRMWDARREMTWKGVYFGNDLDNFQRSVESLKALQIMQKYREVPVSETINRLMVELEEVRDRLDAIERLGDRLDDRLSDVESSVRRLDD